LRRSSLWPLVGLVVLSALAACADRAAIESRADSANATGVPEVVDTSDTVLRNVLKLFYLDHQYDERFLSNTLGVDLSDSAKYTKTTLSFPAKSKYYSVDKNSEISSVEFYLPYREIVSHRMVRNLTTIWFHSEKCVSKETIRQITGIQYRETMAAGYDGAPSYKLISFGIQNSSQINSTILLYDERCLTKIIISKGENEDKN
jgi:hypothetical protein